ncbi:hypothetical protein [Sphingobium tyrosinilyticum]|uniref:Uncharacterized protein n=1 Tax=Sphingobium tyrosinilyticum TaxID=2715436 RepID=A0ABV9EYE1_9SPHN
MRPFRVVHSYGSIVVELERPKIIDLLPDRQRDTIIPGYGGISRPYNLPRLWARMWRGGGYSQDAFTSGHRTAL